MNLMTALKNENNFTLTENGGVTAKSTMSKVYDMFALGGAYRQRTNEDILNLFTSAFKEDKLLAMKCLFYLRDVRGGQGERRFFRVAMKYLANKEPDLVKALIDLIPEYGRWDDLYEIFDTPVENYAARLMYDQIAKDLKTENPSLLAKWLKSENTSSAESRRLAAKTRQHFNMSPERYRKMLSSLRKKINIVESKMSSNDWKSIEYDKIPSKASANYSKAFDRHDHKRFSEFVSNDKQKVNTSTLYPYEIVCKARSFYGGNNVERDFINKLWENYRNSNKYEFNSLVVVDTSASMTWGTSSAKPIDVATSLGIYAAEKLTGPFAGHYISFSRNPRLVEVTGCDFVTKVKQIVSADLCENTDIEKTFDMILQTCVKYDLKQKDLPKSIIVISDMEFDTATRCGYKYGTDMDVINKKWALFGYETPNLVFWNVNARNDRIPMTEKEGVTFVSGCSPVIFDMVMKGKTGFDLMIDTLDSERYKPISLAMYGLYYKAIHFTNE